RASETPQLLCAVDEAGRELSFGELAARAERVAAALAARGVGPGEPVCWQLPTWIESLVLTAALSRLGCVQVPLLPIARERELSVAIRQVRPTLVVCPSVWRGVDYGAMWQRLVDDHLPDARPEVLTCDRALPESAATAALPT